MVLRAGYLALAVRLQEAAEDLSCRDVCARLADALQDAFPGQYAYYLDHYGDAESGDVIYGLMGDTYRASYEISSTGGAAKCTIDTENAEDVVPRTIYEVEADEDDHYSAMEESAKADGTYATLPVYERFISKSERKAAGSGSFAGKGKSFPILKAEDVSAAAHALGRAGSGNYDTGTIKKNIIRIAKEKGWTKYLPKAWRDGGGKSDSKESAVTSDQSGLRLIESAVAVEPIELREAARADYEIKLIAPGKGSSAYYPADVLKRDGPKVFGAGTHVYLNHPTAAEEAARPEGDVSKLAGVLTTPAVYVESHPKGEGLYARMKVFADHAAMVSEKAPHVGMSIRASGIAESSKKQDGLPVLKELTAATSVDVVTKAGAGGMILTESARNAGNTNERGESDMDEATVQRLMEAAVAPFRERAIRGDARELANDLLKSVTLHEAVKTEVVNNCLRDVPKKDGDLDREKFTEAVNAEAKRLGALQAALSGSGRVTGMGAAPATETAEQIAARESAAKQQRESTIDAFTRIMGDPKAAEFAAKGRAN